MYIYGKYLERKTNEISLSRLLPQKGSKKVR